jgi:hypothetical protein
VSWPLNPAVNFNVRYGGKREVVVIGTSSSSSLLIAFVSYIAFRLCSIASI